MKKFAITSAFLFASLIAFCKTKQNSYDQPVSRILISIVILVTAIFIFISKKTKRRKTQPQKIGLSKLVPLLSGNFANDTLRTLFEKVMQSNRYVSLNGKYAHEGSLVTPMGISMNCLDGTKKYFIFDGYQTFYSLKVLVAGFESLLFIEKATGNYTILNQKQIAELRITFKAHPKYSSMRHFEKPPYVAVH